MAHPDLLFPGDTACVPHPHAVSFACGWDVGSQVAGSKLRFSPLAKLVERLAPPGYATSGGCTPATRAEQTAQRSRPQSQEAMPQGCWRRPLSRSAHHCRNAGCNTSCRVPHLREAKVGSAAAQGNLASSLTATPYKAIYARQDTASATPFTGCAFGSSSQSTSARHRLALTHRRTSPAPTTAASSQSFRTSCGLAGYFAEPRKLKLPHPCHAICRLPHPGE